MNETLNFTPLEKSIIYQSLIAFIKDVQESANIAIADNIPAGGPLLWMANQAKELKEKLFAGCEPSEHDPFAHYPNNIEKNQAEAV